MEQYINKADVLAEIERIKKEECPTDLYEGICKLFWFERFLTFINTLEVKDVDNNCIKNDNPKPKFKIGDWIIFDNLIINITGIVDGYYQAKSIEGTYYCTGWYKIDKYARLWSIEDAKDGDVLCYETKDELKIFIYKNGHVHYHCYYCNGHLTTIDSFFVVEKYLLCYIHPATEEQRNTLFTKIKDAGYEWNDEKKELKDIESNFHEGDWITFYGGIPFKILKIEEELNGVLDYLLVCQDGYVSYYNKKYVDENARLWTIQDAKPGDILVCPKYAGDIIPNIFIFKDINIKDNDVFCYCSFLETFRTEGYIANADPINTDFYPATKEQCDTLERAITNAGYTFDFEKKELKITNFSKHLKYNPDAPSIIEQKPKWSEEDECYMAECINAIATKDGWSFEDKRKTKHWLKSIKERII